MWIDVKNQLPNDFRKDCWVWAKDNYTQKFIKEKGFRYSELGWELGLIPDDCLGEDGWTILLWQYEIIPNDP